MMGFAAFSGFIAGVVLVCWAWSRHDIHAADQKVIKLDKKLYRLTEIVP